MAPRPQKHSRRDVVLEGWTGTSPRIRASLADDEKRIRASALGALARDGLVTIADLNTGVADSSPFVRRRALTLIARLWNDELSDGRPAEHIDIHALLRDDDPDVLEVACFVAGECLPATAATVERLSEVCVGHADPLCRESAVAALGAVGDPAGHDAVLQACSDKATVRRRAVLALVAFDSAAAESRLRELASDVDWQVRQSAEDLLAIE